MAILEHQHRNRIQTRARYIVQLPKNGLLDYNFKFLGQNCQHCQVCGSCENRK
jgi:hypothetical protein